MEESGHYFIKSVICFLSRCVGGVKLLNFEKFSVVIVSLIKFLFSWKAFSFIVPKSSLQGRRSRQSCLQDLGDYSEPQNTLTLIHEHLIVLQVIFFSFFFVTDRKSVV